MGTIHTAGRDGRVKKIHSRFNGLDIRPGQYQTNGRASAGQSSYRSVYVARHVLVPTARIRPTAFSSAMMCLAGPGT